VKPGEILDIYQRKGAVWLFDYSGDQAAPHAELTSGLCSDGYFNSAKVLCDPYAVEVLARQLMLRLHARGIRNVDVVVGSAYAAITLSFELARLMGASHGFTEKALDENDPTKSVMTWKRLTFREGTEILQCEELITTFKTTLEVREAIRSGNDYPVEFIPVVATAIWRPENLQTTLDREFDVEALVAKEVRTWKPEDCPLCKQGSPRMRPKQNWAKLTGQTTT